MTAIEKAVAEAGGRTALARLIGVTPQMVQRWCAGTQVSVTSAMAIHEALNGKVTKSQLRPDVWPPRKRRESA